MSFIGAPPNYRRLLRAISGTSSRARYLRIAVLLALITLAWWGRNRWIRTHMTPITIAVADAFSGNSGFIGPQILRGEKMAVDAVNGVGGIDGHPIRLRIFDDKSDPQIAASEVPAIVASPAVAVLGHYLSVASAAAGPGYRDGHMPAVTGTATSDAVTQHNPYYFRAMFVISVQGRQVAHYLDHILHVPSVTIVYSNDVLGKFYLTGFQPAYQGRLRSIAYANKATDRIQAIRAVLQALETNSRRDSMLILAMVDADARWLLPAIRRAGLRMPIMGQIAIGRSSFAEQFATEPEEKEIPGYFTNGVMASVPLILDSTGEAAQLFAAEYRQRYQSEPDWVATKAYEATEMLIQAISQAHIQGTSASRSRDREAIRDQLAALDSRAHSVPGLTAPLFFNAHHDMDEPVGIGVFKDRQFLSAPTQLVPVLHPELIDLTKAIAKGKIIKEDGVYYWLQRVVYTGISTNAISDVHLKTNSFTADFFLWMRYAGDDAPTRIEFPNLIKKEDFNPSTPVEQGEDDGLHYRLYRITGEFKANFDLHDYPFDQQELRIQFQNPTVPREQVTYVIDTRGITPIKNDKAFHGLQSWDFKAITYSVDSAVSDSTRGRSALFHTPERIEYPGFSAHITLKRRFTVFLLKSMVTLVLVALVVFTTLFLPHSLVKERVTIPVTGILTTSVLLSAINNQMSEVGYTMAVEWLFYVFFALCLFVMVISVAEEHLRMAKRDQQQLRLNFCSKIFYLIIVFGVLIFFWLNYIRNK